MLISVHHRGKNTSQKNLKNLTSPPPTGMTAAIRINAFAKQKQFTTIQLPSDFATATEVLGYPASTA